MTAEELRRLANDEHTLTSNDLHVSRWNGAHTDGPNCLFKRVKHGRGEAMVPKNDVVDPVLQKEVDFGVHRGKRWGELPKKYLKKLVKAGKMADKVIRALES